MKIQETLPDGDILTEIGARLAHRRLDMQLSQNQLANQAGLSKRTVERIEAGESTQLLSLVRVLRVLNLLDNFDQLLPEIGPRPLDLLNLHGQTRKRVSPTRKKETPKPKWQWGDDK